jgi:hypothetical protein
MRLSRNAGKLTPWQPNKNMKATSLKDWPKVYRKLGRMRDVTPKERLLLAQGLAATPEERMKMHDDHLRSLGLYSHWDRRESGFKW